MWDGGGGDGVLGAMRCDGEWRAGWLAESTVMRDERAGVWCVCK